MRALGVMLFVLAGAGAGVSLRGVFRAGRPRDLAFAVVAPVAVATAVLGLTMAFGISVL
jgi:hypothetical protein